jgi:hypothetical protein
VGVPANRRKIYGWRGRQPWPFPDFRFFASINLINLDKPSQLSKSSRLSKPLNYLNRLDVFNRRMYRWRIAVAFGYGDRRRTPTMAISRFPISRIDKPDKPR